MPRRSFLAKPGRLFDPFGRIKALNIQTCIVCGVTIAFRLLHTFGLNIPLLFFQHSSLSQSPFGFFILSDCGYSIMFIIKKQGGGFGGSIDFLMGIYRYRNKKWPENIHNVLSFMMFCSFGGSVRGVLDFESRRKGEKREDGKTEEGKRKTEEGKRKTENGRGKTENGKRKTEEGKRKTENGKTEEGKRKTEEGRAKLFFSNSYKISQSPNLPISRSSNHRMYRRVLPGRTMAPMLSIFVTHEPQIL